MRIAMVGPFGFHPNKTMRSRAFNLARLLVDHGHNVRIFMPPWHTPDQADKIWEEEGVELRYIPLRGGILFRTWRLIRETLAWQPQVVHGFKPKAYSGLVMWWLWYFKRHRLRLVTDTDDWEGWGGWNELAPYGPWQKRFFAWQEQWGMRHCHVLTVASRTLESLAWSLGVPSGQVAYLPNGPGIRVQEPALPDPSVAELEGRPTLLLYSRLFEFDLQRLLVILQGVKEAVPDLKVLMVGSGLYAEDETQLSERLATAGLKESVIDVGWVEEERLPGILSAADIGVYLMEDTLLNRTKCPVKLADMLSLGIPVVAESVGQVSEYVRHEQSGLLYTSGDVEGLTAGFARLLKDGAERQRLGQGAKAHVDQHFSWERLTQAVEGAYVGQIGGK